MPLPLLDQRKEPANFSAPVWRVSRAALSLAFIGFLPLWCQGQSPVKWTTNYYSVTGSDFRSIRASIAKKRPWKENFDAETRWRVEWRFSVAARDGTCACDNFTITTAIVTTLPAWTPPADAEPELRARWARYFRELVEHETGHATNGQAAAAGIEKEFSKPVSQTDCAALRQLLNDRAHRVIAEHRRRDEEYDRTTQYGARPARTR